MLIGFAGKADAGKDTAKDWAVKNLGMYPYAFALPIKQMLNAAFGWCMDDWADKQWKERVQPDLGVSPRQLSQKLGTEGRDAIFGRTLWIIIAERTLGIGPLLKRTAISDVRFPWEQDWIHAHRGLVIYIDRPGNNYQVAEHVSENSLDMAKVDLVVHNDGDLAKLYTDLDNIFPYAIT